MIHIPYLMSISWVLSFASGSNVLFLFFFFFFHLHQICYHAGPETDPDQRDFRESFTSPSVVSNFISKYFRGVAATPSIVEPCLYTVSSEDAIRLRICFPGKSVHVATLFSC